MSKQQDRRLGLYGSGNPPVNANSPAQKRFSFKKIVVFRGVGSRWRVAFRLSFAMGMNIMPTVLDSVLLHPCWPNRPRGNLSVTFKAKILVVDDEEDILNTLSGSLEDEGYEV